MTELRQRSPRILDPGFLTFTRKLPCCVCGSIGRSQAAHIRFGNVSLGKRDTGSREKPDDKWCVSLCGPILGAFPPMIGCHAEQHSMNEIEFWRKVCLDPFVIAAWNHTRYLASKPAGGAAIPQSHKPKAHTKPNHEPRQRAKIAKRVNPWPKGQKFQRKAK